MGEDYAKQLKDELEVLHAIEVLEYHNKNLLYGDNKRRCEDKQQTLINCIKLAGKVENK